TSVPVKMSNIVGTVSSLDTIMQQLWPIKTVASTTRATYTTSTVAQAGGSGWSTLLNEIVSVRNSDGSGRYYFGFLPLQYQSGVVGLGYIANPPAAIGDD